MRHLGILGFSQGYLDQDNVVTSSIETVNMATAGIFDADTSLETEIETLIRSSERSGLMDAYQFEFLPNPEDLQKDFLNWRILRRCCEDIGCSYLKFRRCDS